MASGAKTDMERVGIFKEMEYISIGDKYVPAGASKNLKKIKIQNSVV